MERPAKPEEELWKKSWWSEIDVPGGRLGQEWEYCQRKDFMDSLWFAAPLS